MILFLYSTNERVDDSVIQMGPGWMKFFSIKLFFYINVSKGLLVRELLLFGN